VKDWPESIANAWIDFERDKGTLEQVEFCEVKTKEKIDKILEERQKEQGVPIQSESFTQNRKAIKRKLDDQTGKWKHLKTIATKTAKFNVQTKSKLQENLSDTVCQIINKTQEEPKSIVTPPPGFTMENKHMDDKDNEYDNSVTVFISNLDYTATEDEVRDALKPAGPITLFKMIKDYKGRSKGYCYVQLSNVVCICTLLINKKKFKYENRILHVKKQEI